jgi:hypothetical protein
MFKVTNNQTSKVSEGWIHSERRRVKFTTSVGRDRPVALCKRVWVTRSLRSGRNYSKPLGQNSLPVAPPKLIELE